MCITLELAGTKRVLCLPVCMINRVTTDIDKTRADKLKVTHNFLPKLTRVTADVQIHELCMFHFRAMENNTWLLYHSTCYHQWTCGYDKATVVGRAGSRVRKSTCLRKSSTCISCVYSHPNVYQFRPCISLLIKQQ